MAKRGEESQSAQCGCGARGAAYMLYQISPLRWAGGAIHKKETGEDIVVVYKQAIQSTSPPSRLLSPSIPLPSPPASKPRGKSGVVRFTPLCGVGFTFPPHAW